VRSVHASACRISFISPVLTSSQTSNLSRPPRRYHRLMSPITLSWEDWRAVIAVMRAHGLPEREHVCHVEHVLEQHAPDEAMVTLSLTDDVYLRSYNWARLRLGIPLPPMER
jgi:hypothetical protein